MDITTPGLRFGVAHLDIDQRRLLIDGQPAKLGARAFDVLLALIERRDRTVGKNELLELIWPHVVVEDNNLQVHISTLRKLLGPQAIATIPGRGYRFTAELNLPAPTAPQVTPTTPTTKPPTQQEPLYGRDDDIGAVDKLLRTHQQVSIVGAGGIGKTRLASAIAAAQRESFPDGVWWVELAAISDPELVISVVAQAIGVSASDQRPLRETLIALLRNQTALLVLDNCEHLPDAAAECAQTIATHAPGVRVLVTTQASLRTSAEQIYRLGGLDTAGSSDSPGAACALFMARAQAADPRLQPSETQLASVVEICRRLDGMPLAIELAAARVRLLGIDGVRARLDERFHILTGGTRVAMRRHQTLRAALEWSHSLLSPAEQAVFRRLGVFAGGFTLELAQEVACDEQIDRWAVLDLLGQVIDKSLVVANSNDPPRYRLLETMRAFALEKLATAGETPALLRRHAEAMLAFLLPLDERRWTATLTESIRYGAELDNLRGALDWAESEAGDRALACALIGSSSRIWTVHQLLNEGIGRALRLLPLPDGLAPEIEARFNLLLGSLGGYFGARRECFFASLRAAELFRSLGNVSRQIDALSDAAQTGSRLDEAQRVTAAIAEAEALIGPHAPLRQTASLALANALNYMSLGQHEQAVESALRQAALYRDNGHEWGVQVALSNAALAECGLGRFDSAIAQLRSVLEVLPRINAPYGVGAALAFLACAHALRGERDEALANGRAAVPHLQRGQNVPWMLLFIALTHARHGAEARAVSLVGYVDSEFAHLGWVLWPMFTRVRDEILARAQAALGPAEFERDTAAGAALTEEQAIALAFDVESDLVLKPVTRHA